MLREKSLESIQHHRINANNDADWTTCKIFYICLNKYILGNEASRYFIHFKVNLFINKVIKGATKL